MNMSEQTITDMLGHLEAACHAASKMLAEGTLTQEEYSRDYNSVIARMEDRVRSVKERIKCTHDYMTITHVDGGYGDGIIDVKWMCNNCGVVMRGQLSMSELWCYDTTAKEIQMNFEKVSR
tara:strand:+ start:13077 stop:13439 length:363 start_codon:yes stop_codon:yes gene_type:complete